MFIISWFINVFAGNYNVARMEKKTRNAQRFSLCKYLWTRLIWRLGCGLDDKIGIRKINDQEMNWIQMNLFQ
jgi:hypothetical protein